MYGQGSISLSSDQPLSKALPMHLKYSLASNSTTPSGVINSGFYGINIQPQMYNTSFFYKPLSGAILPGNELSLGFRDSANHITYGMATVDVSNAVAGNWTKFSSSIIVNKSVFTSNGIYFIEFPLGSSGEFELNLVSCFPPTYKNRPNGARIDIAQVIADLKPGFVRLPGGNDLERRSISTRFIWNDTIGSLENRSGRVGTWTGYNTEGFGLIELLTFTEDIGAISILGVYAGYSLDQKSVPRNELQPYIDQVINEIDFLTAPADQNRMDAFRISLGREKPFDIKYVEIGNEDFLGLAALTYNYRWTAYYEALSKRYPNITFIATTNKSISSPPVVDDHRLFERSSRLGSKIFIDEFAFIFNVDQNEPKLMEYPSK